MKELVTYLATSLAGHPDEVCVTETPGEQGVLLELAAADDDLHRLIGKHGRTIKAMRSLLAASAAKSGQRYYLKIAGEISSSDAVAAPSEVIGEAPASEVPASESMAPEAAAEAAS